jgi:hypothetical protein
MSVLISSWHDLPCPWVGRGRNIIRRRSQTRGPLYCFGLREGAGLSCVLWRGRDASDGLEQSVTPPSVEERRQTVGLCPSVALNKWADSDGCRVSPPQSTVHAPSYSFLWGRVRILNFVGTFRFTLQTGFVFIQRPDFIGQFFIATVSVCVCVCVYRCDDCTCDCGLL